MNVESLIVVLFVIAVLVGLVIFMAIHQNLERDQWRDERRFLTDRLIADNIGDIIALDRVDQKGKSDPLPERDRLPQQPIGL